MIRQWLSSTAEDAALTLEELSYADSKEWAAIDGALLHRSRGFFGVVGVRWASANGVVTERPFIDQQETGVLGLLMRQRAGRAEILMHAKVEPGNVGGAQLAPTCQSTGSNARRLHGGAAPPFSEPFWSPGRAPVYDRLQSEQGSRFWRKRNRNVLMRAPADPAVPPSHRWLEVDHILEVLHEDYLVNTDARSALVCSPWRALVNRQPFSRVHSSFGIDLFRSAQSSSRPATLAAVKAAIRAARATSIAGHIVRLDQLAGWRFEDRGLVPVDGRPFVIRPIRVSVRGREVETWDQPIVDAASDGLVVLACGRIDGVLHFHLRARAEAGSYHRVELTATVVVEPGEEPDRYGGAEPQGVMRAECRQSEEGGRFFRDANVYKIVDVGDVNDGCTDGYWLTLGDVRQLLDEEGWLTNEVRSALSLLLPWM